MLRWMESFDHIDAATIGMKYTSVTGAPGIDTVIGRHGSRSLTASWASLWSVNLTLDPQPTWSMGFALQLVAFPTAAHAVLARWLDGTTNQMELGINTAGQLTLWRGGSALLATSPAALTTGTFHHVEWLVTFHGSAGVATVRLNGQTVISLSGTSTIGSANASADRFRLGNVGEIGGPINAVYYDDLYVCDGTGLTNKTLLGDCRVDCLFPNEDGGEGAWTPSTPGAHYLMVDDPNPTGDTDYLSTLTSGARETHAFTDAPPTMLPVIYGVQHALAARKDDAGVRGLKHVLTSDATTVVGATTHTLDVTYLFYKQMWETNPDTDAAWTPSAINALEAGAECA